MFIDLEQLNSLPVDEFRRRTPFPWFEISRFLTPSGFEALHQTFPHLELFEKHVNQTRAYGQRPHNRYYLAYEASIYHPRKSSGAGIVQRNDLSQEWTMFIEELQTSEPYLQMIRSLFELSSFRIRFAWHMGFKDSEVSPHVDSSSKAGTHILYFNTRQDWEPAWGGSTLVLGNKQSTSDSPDFTDFAQTVQIENVGNRSFLFKNGSNAWHGMKPLQSPQGVYRRTFNIIFESSRNGRPILLSRGTNVVRRVLNRLKN